jgi:hypothetical protein
MIRRQKPTSVNEERLRRLSARIKISEGRVRLRLARVAGGVERLLSLTTPYGRVGPTAD